MYWSIELWKLNLAIQLGNLIDSSLSLFLPYSKVVFSMVIEHSIYIIMDVGSTGVREVVVLVFGF